jgi:4-carboxymuconolactone decarboxylase
MDDDAGWSHPLPAERLAPLPRDQRPPEAEDVLRPLRERFEGDNDPNLFATMAHNPRLLQRWTAFGATLLFSGELPGRVRELLIVRTAWNTRAHYEWGHHVPLARREGLTEAEIEAVTVGPTADVWSDDDRLLLQAADELHRDATIGDATWNGLSQRFSPAQLVELCMLVGQYHLTAFTINALGIQLEPPELRPRR